MAFAISVDVKLIDNITSQLRGVSREFDRAGKAARRASDGFRSAGQAMQRVGRGLTLFVTAPIVALGVSSILTAAKMQRMEISLSSLMGTATGAKEEMKKLIEVAKLPGLGITEVVDASIKFQSAGLSADKARESILALGNAVALAGGGKAEFNRAMLQLSQIRNKATGFGQDLKALTESLPLLGTILEEAFGTRASDQISQLGFTGEQVFKKMIEAMQGLPNVGKSLANSIENLGDAFVLFQVRIGETINEVFNLEENIEKLGDFLREVAERFDKLSPGMKKFIIFAAIAVAAIGPLLIAAGLLFAAIGGIVGGLAAMQIIFAAIAPFLPLILAIVAVFIAMGLAVKQNLPVFKELFINLFQRMKQISVPVLKLLRNGFEKMKPVIKTIGKFIAAGLVGMLFAALKLVDLLLIGFIAIADAHIIAAKLLGFNTEVLEKQLDLVREIQQGFEAAAGDVKQTIKKNEIFNPTTNVNIENTIVFNQDENKLLSVASVTSNAQRSTVKTFNTGIMSPIFT